MPIVIDGEVVGGVGISAGTAEQDQVVAQGAVDYFFSKIDSAD